MFYLQCLQGTYTSDNGGGLQHGAIGAMPYIFLKIDSESAHYRAVGAMVKVGLKRWENFIVLLFYSSP